MLSQNPKYVSLVGIDPGSTHLGVAIMRVEPESWSIIDTRATTFHAQSLIRDTPDLVLNQGERLARIRSLGKRLYIVFKNERPTFIATESPFYSQRRPSAFSVLTEVIDAVREAVFRYDDRIQLMSIDPPSVKKAVGAPGNADKDVVKNFVKSNTDINYIGNKDILLLDEHSIDAIAVCYAQYVLKGKELCLLNSK